MLRKIFLYWDNPPGCTKPPEYIQLCWESIYKHCQKDFEIHFVTTSNVKRFLPNISEKFFTISQINNKSNFLRYSLLKKYGGIWLDSDLVLFDTLLPILDYFNHNKDCDLIATGSPGYKYGEPETGFIASKANGKIITKAVELITNIINNNPDGKLFPWSSMGPSLLRKAAQTYEYVHLPYYYLQPIHWSNVNIFTQSVKLNDYINDQTIGMMLYNQGFKNCHNPILNMTQKQILDSNLLIGQVFRKAFN